MVFVNENCIGCGVCESIAGSIFKVENGVSHVVKQPDTTEEELVDQAIGACPVEAIKKENPVIEMPGTEKMAA